MEHFKSTEAGSIDQKENDPSLARDKNDGITKQSAKLNFTQQVAVPQLPQSQQPLRTRNMTTQSQTQTELLEKFRKLRQWQQQQQESMLRQQQQAMETLKMEQSQLQSILAAQRKLQEQQNISSLTVRSPLSEEDAKRTSPLIVQSQSQQMPRTQNVSSEFVGQVTTDLHKAIHTSSLLPVSSSSATSLKLGELSSRIQENVGLVNSQKPNESSRPQVVVNEEQRLDGSITSFNATVYPMMWNSPNYCLPLGATSLSTGTRLMHLQGKPVVSSGNPMPNLESSTKGMHEVTQGYQMLSSSEELEQLRKYHFTTEIQSHLEMCDENDKEKDYVPVMLPQQLPLQRLWSRNPGVQLLASVETNADEQSEADAMSGVYPLYDSESEVGVNELGYDRSGDEEVDADYDNGEEFEESNERDKTVIDLHSLPVESERKTEQPQGGSKTEVNEEIRPIKPGIGGESFVKTFEELLEQQLKLDEASKPVTAPEATNQIPQRTFLRKGQGLARFKGKSTSNKTVGQPRGYASQLTAVGQKKEKKTGNPESSFPEGNNKLTVQNGAREMQSKVTRKVASKSPQLATEASQETAPGRRLQSKGSSGPKTQSPSIGEIMVTTTGNQPIPVSQSGVFTRAEAMSNPSGLLNSIDASFQMRLQELEEKQEMEYEELEEFELLEQAAANASFSSNSSVVVKVLAKARGNALGGKSVIQGQNGTNNRGPRGILSPVDTGYGSGDGKVTSSAAVDHPELNHVNALHDNDSENEEDDVTLQEMSLDSALELDHGAESKYDTAINNQQKGPVHLNPTSPSPFAIEEDFNDEEAWGEIKKQAEANTKKDKKNDDDDDFYEDDDDSDVTISDIFPLITSTPPAHLKGGDAQEHERAVDSRVDGMTALTPPTSALVTKLFPQLKPKMKPSAGTKQSVSEQVPQNRPGEGKAEESSEAVQSIAVRQKLKELETEIDKFRGENAALAKMRAEREEGLKKLQTEIAAFEKQKTEELERLEQFREEELRKLRRERRVFEKYQKAARTIPDKKEREEIEALRAQVAELQDELKRRETRWSAASTRSRQKIEALEQEKKELQDDIKLLEQYRLQQWREDEQAKLDRKNTREEEETGHQKPLQRKIAKTTEEDSGTRLLPTRRSPPLRSEESVLWSTPEDAVIGPENRLTRLGVDANNIQSGVPRRGEKPSPDTFPELNDERSEIASMSTTERNDIVETQRSKRSPRQRSETSNSSEKVKRSVHFRDEDTLQHSIPAEGDSLIEKIGRQDQREIMHSDGKVEKVNSDGSRVIAFANGTRKDISADGQTIIVTFFNGDVKQIMPDQRVIYYYSEAQTTHTTYADGLEVLQFPSKQIEKHYPNGTKEIVFPDQTIKYLHPNGAEECVFSDGTIQKVGVDGERTIEFPNGQRETHTKYYKKREYPDGTVKTVYPDGRTETRYATGRVRVKDWDGRVLVDSQSNQMR